MLRSSFAELARSLGSGWSRSLPVVTAVLLALTAVTAAAAEDAENAGAWKVVESDDDAGWTLSTRPEPGSDFLRYRMESRSTAPIERVIEALRLKSQDDRYLPESQTRTVLERGEDYSLAHVHIDAPFIADRDAVLRLRWRTDPATGIHYVEWGQPEGKLPPVDDGAVRIISTGSWQATPLSSGGTRLVYESHSELGSVPAWLINRMMNDQIINEMLTLQSIIADDLPAVAASPDAAR